VLVWEMNGTLLWIKKQGNLDRNISILYQIIEFGTKTLSYYTLEDKSFLRPHEYSCGFLVFQ
jgi:hypothetical protein